MPNTPGPGDFLIAASLLNVETPRELNDREKIWFECEDARARSAVSRSYYAVFRVLKARLVPRRAEWRADPRRFPSRGIHDAIKKAVEAQLSDKHPFVIEFKGLLKERNDSDYGFAPIMTCAEADDHVLAADEAIGLANTLTDAELDGIAFHIVQLDAEANRRRNQGRN